MTYGLYFHPTAGLVQSLLDFLKGLPGIRGIVKREHTKMLVCA